MSRKLVAEIKVKGGPAAYRKLDVTDRKDAEDFVKFAENQSGKVDVVVNNAGRMPLSRLEALKVDEGDRMVDVNIKGVLYGTCSRTADLQAPGLRSLRQHIIGRRSSDIPHRRGLLRYEIRRERNLGRVEGGEPRHPRDRDPAGRHRVLPEPITHKGAREWVGNGRNRCPPYAPPAER